MKCRFLIFFILPRTVSHLMMGRGRDLKLLLEQANEKSVPALVYLIPSDVYISVMINVFKLLKKLSTTSKIITAYNCSAEPQIQKTWKIHWMEWEEGSGRTSTGRNTSTTTHCHKLHSKSNASPLNIHPVVPARSVTSSYSGQLRRCAVQLSLSLYRTSAATLATSALL